MSFKSEQLYPENDKDLQSLFPVDIDAMGILLSKTQERCEELYKDLISHQNKSIYYYDQIQGLTSTIAAISRLLSMVIADSKFINAVNTSLDDLVNWQQEKLDNNLKLYKKLESQLEDFHFSSAESKNRFLNSIVKQKRDFGLTLSDANRQRLQDLWDKANSLGGDFERNITTDERKIHVKPRRLRNISENYLKDLPRAYDGCFDLYADTTILSNSNDELARKAFWRLSVRTGYPKNKEVLENLILVRDKAANLLGFSSYAQLEIQDEMAQTTQDVEQFLATLTKESIEKAQDEIENMLSYKPKDVILVKAKIKPWDFLWLKTNYKKYGLNCSSDWLSQYFPFEYTFKELLKFIENFFGLEFKFMPKAKFWDKTVHSFEVHQDGKLKGYLIFDLYIRKNKYRYTLEKPIIPSSIQKNYTTVKWNNGVTVVVSSLLSQWQNNTSLLDLNEVVTLAHEIGHALHTLMGAQELISQSGTAIERDFVEAPGQMLEKWVLNENVLSQLSNHYKTGEKLTPQEIRVVQKAHSFDEYDGVLEQVVYARLSLELFLEGKSKNIPKIFKKIFTQTRPYLLFDDNNHSYASFDHLVAYGSRYYCYLWSDRFAKKIYNKLAKEALQKNSINGIGKEYLQKVIMPGGSLSPWSLLSNFFSLPVEKLKQDFMHKNF